MSKYKATFKIPKMDCPSEEKLIRVALQDQSGIQLLKFDLTGRSLTAFHDTDAHLILKKLVPLNFGASLASNQELSEVEANLLQIDIAQQAGNEKAEAGVLKVLLAINAIMFLFEIAVGFIAQSTGLIADAMDMFADAGVYGVSLFAVGKALHSQRTAARLAGYTQMLLAGFALLEVGRRYFVGSDPESITMMWVSAVALIANVACLVLISSHRDGGVHMKASLIFSANDVLANLGVILAGVLVYFSGSSFPDLVIGLLIAVLVFRGSLSILKISKTGD